MSENSSLKSNVSKPKTPSADGGKKVGFARPTLIIPPPQMGQRNFTPHSASIRSSMGHSMTPGSIGPHQDMYGRKASMFVFDQLNGIKSFTMNTAKSGLGIGEKCSYWMYAQIRSLSKKWFTHFFLTFVLILYTLGGALMFSTIEDMKFPLKPYLKTLLVHIPRMRRYFMTLGNYCNHKRTEGGRCAKCCSRCCNACCDFLLQSRSYSIALLLVMGAFTFGGALLFAYVEGRHEELHSKQDGSNGAFEEEIKAKNMRKERYNLIRELRNLSLEMPERTSDGEWEGEAARRFLVYEEKVVQFHKNYTLLLSSEGRIWTLWNAVVYCATIYTTIGMDASATPERDAVEYSTIDMEKIKAMLTDEQVLSDAVARRRRKFTKKHTSSLTRREPTPGRTLEIERTTSDEDLPEKRPKTPERKRPRKVRSLGVTAANGNVDMTAVNGVSRNNSSCSSKNDSGSKVSEPIVEDRKKSISDLAQEELVSLFNKTKKTLIRGRNRFRRTEKEQIKRSQSAPYKIPQEELIESFKQAQLLSVESTPTRLRKYSDSELINQSLRPHFEPLKSFRPEVETFVRQRKKQRQYSNKIIEILDPKTKNVLARQTIFKPPEFRLRDLFKVMFMFSPLEIYRNYKVFKKDMNHEVRLLRRMWNRCMFELFLIMMFCGMGGIIFKFTEGGFENLYKCGVKRVKRDFIDLLWIKSHNLREEDWKSMARNRLRIFEEELHAAHEAGMTSYSGQRSWSFLNAVVYALTVVTTIGYGHLYPTTNTGRALTIVYSIIGIPLFLIALTDFGKLFTRGIKFLWSFVRRLYYTGSCRNVRKSGHVQEIFKGAQMMYDIATFRRPSMIVIDPEMANQTETSTENPMTPSLGTGEETPTTPNVSVFEIDDEFNLPITVALFILISYIFIGAVIYCMWEQWNFFASFYFVFISMSTIGFGDIVPQKPLCMFVTIVYLVFGLALMSMCINVVQEKLSDTFKQASAKLSATIGFESEEGSMLSAAENVELPGIHYPRTGNTLTVPQTPKGGESLRSSPPNITDNTARPPNTSNSMGAQKPPTPPSPQKPPLPTKVTEENQKKTS